MPEQTPEEPIYSEWGEGNPETDDTGVYIGEWPDGYIEWDGPDPRPAPPPAPDPPTPPGPDAPIPKPIKRPKPPLP